VHIGHPDFGQAVPCTCQETADSGNRAAALRRYSNLGALSRITFATTDLEGRLPDAAAHQMFSQGVTIAARFAEDPQGWLVLTGPSGSGKTHLAVAIANRCIERDQTAFFIVAADLLDHLRAAYSPDNPVSYDELFEQVRNVPVLVLDDLSMTNATPWAQEKLFQVINHRYNNALPTVVTVRGPLQRLDDSLRTRLEGTDGTATVVQLGNFNSRLVLGIGEVRPEMLQRMTFKNFDTLGGPGASPQDQESLDRVMHTAQSFAAEPEGWLLLSGPRGCGKTHLAVAIAGVRLDKGSQVFFAFYLQGIGVCRKVDRIATGPTRFATDRAITFLIRIKSAGLDLVFDGLTVAAPFNLHFFLVVSDSSRETLPDQEPESKGIPQTLN